MEVLMAQTPSDTLCSHRGHHVCTGSLPSEWAPLRPTAVTTAHTHVAKPEGHLHLPIHPLKWLT